MVPFKWSSEESGGNPNLMKSHSGSAFHTFEFRSAVIRSCHLKVQLNSQNKVGGGRTKTLQDGSGPFAGSARGGKRARDWLMLEGGRC